DDPLPALLGLLEALGDPRREVGEACLRVPQGLFRGPEPLGLLRAVLGQPPLLLRIGPRGEGRLQLLPERLDRRRQRLLELLERLLLGLVAEEAAGLGLEVVERRLEDVAEDRPEPEPEAPVRVLERPGERLEGVRAALADLSLRALPEQEL